ncbi:MAG: hypothetical protein JWQ43_4173, partial [Glaciihabitans sp.]|nr:hypothetical protein [Glaciihabitans sp.]
PCVSQSAGEVLEYCLRYIDPERVDGVIFHGLIVGPIQDGGCPLCLPGTSIYPSKIRSERSPLPRRLADPMTDHSAKDGELVRISGSVAPSLGCSVTQLISGSVNEWLGQSAAEPTKG